MSYTDLRKPRALEISSCYIQSFYSHLWEPGPDELWETNENQEKAENEHEERGQEGDSDFQTSMIGEEGVVVRVPELETDLATKVSVKPA